MNKWVIKQQIIALTNKNKRANRPVPISQIVGEPDAAISINAAIPTEIPNTHHFKLRLLISKDISAKGIKTLANMGFKVV